MKEAAMRTTLNLDDQLIDEARHRAIESKTSLAGVIENALREFFSKPRQHEKIKLVTAPGSGVNLGDSRSLHDVMDVRP